MSGTTQLHVEVQTSHERAVLALRGDLDAYTRRELTDQLDAALSAATGNITLELSGVSFMDSSGLSAIVSAAKRLRERGDDLVLESPPPMITKVLEMTGVDKLVKVRRSAR